MRDTASVKLSQAGQAGVNGAGSVPRAILTDRGSRWERVERTGRGGWGIANWKL